jgi:hypothetical protein
LLFLCRMVFAREKARVFAAASHMQRIVRGRQVGWDVEARDGARRVEGRGETKRGRRGRGGGGKEDGGAGGAVRGCEVREWESRSGERRGVERRGMV